MGRGGGGVAREVCVCVCVVRGGGGTEGITKTHSGRKRRQHIDSNSQPPLRTRKITEKTNCAFFRSDINCAGAAAAPLPRPENKHTDRMHRQLARKKNAANEMKLRPTTESPDEKGTNYNKTLRVLGLVIVQDLCENRGVRPGLSVLTSLLVSVDVKLY